jgi:hypothetical protein
MGRKKRAISADWLSRSRSVPPFADGPLVPSTLAGAVDDGKHRLYQPIGSDSECHEGDDGDERLGPYTVLVSQYNHRGANRAAGPDNRDEKRYEHRWSPCSRRGGSRTTSLGCCIGHHSLPFDRIDLVVIHRFTSFSVPLDWPGLF